jgi:hypothetical protein
VETNRLAFSGRTEADYLAVPGVAACFRIAYFPLEMELFIGTMKLPITGLPPDGMRLLLERKGLAVVEGRLPEAEKPEVALSGDILLAHGLRLGDTLKGLRVVGRLEGPGRLGVFPVDAADAPEAAFDYKRGFFVVAVPGREAEVARAIRERFPGAATDVTTPASIRAEIDKSTHNLDVLTAVIILGAVTVIGLLVGLIHRIYYLQRTREFGILWACGMTRGRLMLRTFAESAILTAGSCALGFGLAMAGLLIFRVLYLEAHALVVELLDPGAVWATLLLLAGALVASVGGAALRLFRFDPVAVIDEGGN